MADIMQATILPGPCPVTGCPPTTEIVCLKVAKVFDSCAQTDVVSISTTALTVTTASLLGIAFSATVAVGAPAVGSTPPDATGCVNVLVTIPFTVVFAASTTTITFTPVTGTAASVATLYAPTGTTLQVDATLISSAPVPTIVVVSVTESTVVLTSVVSACVVITSEMTVQLLVPAYGYCEIPQCSTAGILCPPAIPPQVNPSPCR